MDIKDKKIKDLLDRLYLDYQKKYSSKDPVWSLHNFSSKKDIEVLGFIVSCYTYGQVDQINKFIDSFLMKSGNKPYEFTINFVKRKDTKYLRDLYYRFNTGSDLIWLIENLSYCLNTHGSLNKMFRDRYDHNDENVIPASAKFITDFYKTSAISSGHYFNYLLPNPENGSTCKRWFLYLRWMIRKDEIDTGVWEGIPPSKLIIPVDTHIARVSKKFGFIKRRSVDLKFAVELTEKLKMFDKNDPVKYDFSLCHSGIDNRQIGVI